MKQQNLSLGEIRQALSKADAERTRKELPDEERKLLEQTCVMLRDAERSAIIDTETGLVKGFQNSAGNVNLQAKEIRVIVTRMNKVPKILDTTESVIKECVKVLKAIAGWVLMLILMVSCSTLSKSQMRKINAFASVQDSVNVGPEAIFRTLADVRLERGLIYSASLTDVESHIHELNAMAKAAVQEEQASAKANICFNILSSYARALKSLSAETRWKQYGTELRGLGRNMDSLAIAYNKLEWGTLYEPGLGKSLGKTSGYLTEQYMKRRQRKLMMDMLTVGDTIVSSCCNALIASFKSEQFIGLIDNEEQGLESDYRAYLNSLHAQDRFPEMNVDRTYLAQKAQLEKARKLRKQSITMLQSLEKAHRALVLEMDKHRTFSEFSSELFELSSQVSNVVELCND